MPELPELEALSRFLDAHSAGRVVEGAEVASISALKTAQPPLGDLIGQRVEGWRRRGKFLCLELEWLHLVVHLGRAGWVIWRESLPEGHLRAGRRASAGRVRLSGGCGFELTEAGTERRLAIWIVSDPELVPQLAGLGPDPLEPALDALALGTLMARSGGTVKSALTDQSVLAGVGNAWSDEILHRARLSPLGRARALTPGQLEELLQALRGVLEEALAGAAGLSPEDLKADKHSRLRIHGRAGRPCPICAGPIRQVAYANRSLQYCPNCQTGGRVLADRRLSRLLK